VLGLLCLYRSVYRLGLLVYFFNTTTTTKKNLFLENCKSPFSPKVN